MFRFAVDPLGDGTGIDNETWAKARADWEADREREVVPKYLKAPTEGLWEITGRCCLRCVYCCNESPRTPADLEWPVMERLAQELVDLKVFSVGVSGGEPTLHPRYIDILRILRESGIGVSTITNGWTMTPQLAGSMARYAGAVQVSLDGPSAEVHDRLRGRKSSFERAVRAIRLLRDAGVGQLAVSFASTRLNVDSFPRTAELCASLGVSALRTQPLALVGRAAGQADLEPTGEQARRLQEFLATSGGQCGETRLQWVDTSIHLKVGLTIGLATLVRITNDGNLGLTPYYPLFFGNASESTIAEVWERGLRTGWHHEAVKALFGSLPDSPVSRLPPGPEKPLYLGCGQLSGGDAA